MVGKYDPSMDHARTIAEATHGREFLRVVSIAARERPGVLEPFIGALRELMREAVRLGMIHPRTLEDLDEPKRLD